MVFSATTLFSFPVRIQNGDARPPALFPLAHRAALVPPARRPVLVPSAGRRALVAYSLGFICIGLLHWFVALVAYLGLHLWFLCIIFLSVTYLGCIFVLFAVRHAYFAYLAKLCGFESA